MIEEPQQPEGEPPDEDTPADPEAPSERMERGSPT